MYIESAHLAIIHDILRRLIPNREVRVFGSRVHGQHLKPFSDLDLAIMGEAPLSDDQLAKLTHAFSQSDLPYKVDLLDFASADTNFKNIILRNSIVLQPSNQ